MYLSCLNFLSALRIGACSGTGRKQLDSCARQYRTIRIETSAQRRTPFPFGNHREKNKGGQADADENCFPNTLDTTVHYRTQDGEDDTFVYTGDIHAMWLRDSGAQVWPYVQFANEDADLKKMIRGVILRQWKCINIDPYANGFNDGPTGGPWMNDLTDMKPELHERKYEIDSLCYPLRLAYHYWEVTGDASIFGEEWLKAIGNIVKTFREQQRKDGPGSYTFQRKTERQLDTMSNNGYGHPVKPVGLIVSSFRPSDDASTYQFLIPANFLL